MSLTQNRTIARPYAQALFQWGLDNDCLGTVRSWIDDLRTLYDSPDVQKCAKHPGLDRAVLTQTLVDILKPSYSEHALHQWLREVIMEKRLQAIPAIEDWLHQAIDHHNKECHVDVQTSHELTETQWLALTKALQQRLQQHICIHSTIEPSLMGGIRIRYQDNCLDASLSNLLSSFKRSLHSPGAMS